MTYPALLKPTPLKRIRQLAQSRCGLGAVPFLGTNAAGLLPLRRSSVLVTRFTLKGVKDGLVSPKEVLGLSVCQLRVSRVTDQVFPVTHAIAMETCADASYER